jgi:hypothetical protein
MIILYNKVSEKTIREEAKDTIERITEWFQAYPRRRVCRAELWYGKMVSVRKKHVEEDINKAAEEAIAK